MYGSLNLYSAHIEEEENIINNPSKTLFLSYDDAVDLNAFKAPIDLLDEEEILLEEEINRPKKYWL